MYPNMHPGDRKEQCDPMVVVYADDSDHTGKKFTFLAQTERLQNAHDPRFQRPLIIQFNPRSKVGSSDCVCVDDGYRRGLCIHVCVSACLCFCV